MKIQVVAGAMLLAGVAGLNVSAAEMTELETKIAAKHKILTSDTWGGGHRMIFDFNGLKGWVVEPKTPRADKPWVWTMQWMGAFLERTGAPTLVRNGYYHVHLSLFASRADDEGLKQLAAFHDYLTGELGFAPKTRLIGMSWGGFFSIRYANAYPEKVSKIYLDAPLLNFAGFDQGIGPWAKVPPAKGTEWTDDPRMPVNMAESVAKAGIPVMLLYGGQDKTVNPDLNCRPFAARFKKAGGNITVNARDGYGHHPHGFETGDIPTIVKFFE